MNDKLKYFLAGVLVVVGIGAAVVPTRITYLYELKVQGTNYMSEAEVTNAVKIAGTRKTWSDVQPAAASLTNIDTLLLAKQPAATTLTNIDSLLTAKQPASAFLTNIVTAWGHLTTNVPVINALDSSTNMLHFSDGILTNVTLNYWP